MAVIRDSPDTIRLLEEVLIDLPSDFDRDAYEVFDEENNVRKVLEEQMDGENMGLAYKVQFEDGRIENVSAYLTRLN